MGAKASFEDRVRALEELRTADRILAAVVADLEPGADEWYRQTAAETQASSEHLADAHRSVCRAASALGGTPTQRWPELRRWGSAFHAFPDIADSLAGFAEGVNHREAKRVHDYVRSLFDAVRGSDSALADTVEPLADWSALDVDEEHNLWKLYPWQMAVGILAALFALWRFVGPYL
ncbi:MAG: hypothetical protein ACE37F_16700 [Nannocystaceae bacterium]|nr:hypothetical protein [bacterium]